MNLKDDPMYGVPGNKWRCGYDSAGHRLEYGPRRPMSARKVVSHGTQAACLRAAKRLNEQCIFFEVGIALSILGEEERTNC